jgi:hypothetical protein
MMQDELINGDSTVSVLDCVHENLSELVSSDSDDKIGHNKINWHITQKTKQLPCI